MTLVSGGQEFIYSPIKSNALVHLQQSNQSFLGKGRYIVNYEVIEAGEDDINYSAFAVAVTCEFDFPGSALGAKVGGKSKLIPALSSYECIFKVDKSDKYGMGHVWIALSENPDEIDELRNILEEYSIAGSNGISPKLCKYRRLLTKYGRWTL